MRKRAFSVSSLFGKDKLPWKRLCDSMGGSGYPWFFAEQECLRTWQRSDPACLDAEIGGNRFGESNLYEYVRSNRALSRRIMLVDCIDAVSWPLKFAAAIVRARVQEQVDCPLLEFALLEPVNMYFTKAFAQAEKKTVAVARSAQLRRVGDALFKEVRVLRWQRFCEELAKCANAKQTRTFHCIYKDREDPQLQGMSGALVGTAKSFEEFFGKVPGPISIYHHRFSGRLARSRRVVQGGQEP